MSRAMRKILAIEKNKWKNLWRVRNILSIVCNVLCEKITNKGKWNIYATCFYIAVRGICSGRLFVKKYKRGFGIYSLFSAGKRNWFVIIIIFLGVVISFICKLDGWYYGICLIAVFYLFHDKTALKTILAVLVMYVCGLDFSIWGLIEPNFLSALTSLIFINLYNGQRGIKMKYLFYWFYPTHLFLFFLISTYIVIPMVS